ncbi:hypothetical protein BESB_069570 [Besnoitia besnoiti]|uniref:HTH CENPB-type domain-containing protein n=1 Tax=Besnoitia besnoiti TaxID=94643 RepID=A0A2A9MCH4_BESBE|nr:hypothetical protein BESB_069570 [Besnoitia besnoiti]PFH34924.1 hypothetical protein BESB_069570 [Besnoitia besnoiti]
MAQAAATPTAAGPSRPGHGVGHLLPGTDSQDSREGDSSSSPPGALTPAVARAFSSSSLASSPVSASVATPMLMTVGSAAAGASTGATPNAAAGFPASHATHLAASHPGPAVFSFAPSSGSDANTLLAVSSAASSLPSVSLPLASSHLALSQLHPALSQAAHAGGGAAANAAAPSSHLLSQLGGSSLLLLSSPPTAPPGVAAASPGGPKGVVSGTTGVAPALVAPQASGTTLIAGPGAAGPSLIALSSAPFSASHPHHAFLAGPGQPPTAAWVVDAGGSFSGPFAVGAAVSGVATAGVLGRRTNTQPSPAFSSSSFSSFPSPAFQAVPAHEGGASALAAAIAAVKVEPSAGPEAREGEADARTGTPTEGVTETAMDARRPGDALPSTHLSVLPGCAASPPPTLAGVGVSSSSSLPCASGLLLQSGTGATSAAFASSSSSPLASDVASGTAGSPRGDGGEAVSATGGGSPAQACILASDAATSPTSAAGVILSAPVSGASPSFEGELARADSARAAAALGSPFDSLSAHLSPAQIQAGGERAEASPAAVFFTGRQGPAGGDARGVQAGVLAPHPSQPGLTVVTSPILSSSFPSFSPFASSALTAVTVERLAALAAVVAGGGGGVPGVQGVSPAVVTRDSLGFLGAAAGPGAPMADVVAAGAAAAVEGPAGAPVPGVGAGGAPGAVVKRPRGRPRGSKNKFPRTANRATPSAAASAAAAAEVSQGEASANSAQAADGDTPSASGAADAAAAASPDVGETGADSRSASVPSPLSLPAQVKGKKRVAAGRKKKGADAPPVLSAAADNGASAAVDPAGSPSEAKPGSPFPGPVASSPGLADTQGGGARPPACVPGVSSTSQLPAVGGSDGGVPSGGAPVKDADRLQETGGGVEGASPEGGLSRGPFGAAPGGSGGDGVAAGLSLATAGNLAGLDAAAHAGVAFSGAVAGGSGARGRPAPAGALESADGVAACQLADADGGPGAPAGAVQVPDVLLLRSPSGDELPGAVASEPGVAGQEGPAMASASNAVGRVGLGAEPPTAVEAAETGASAVHAASSLSPLPAVASAVAAQGGSGDAAAAGGCAGEEEGAPLASAAVKADPAEASSSRGPLTGEALAWRGLGMIKAGGIRRSYSASFKLAVVAAAEGMCSNTKAAKQMGVTESLVRRWRMQKHVLEQLPGEKLSRRGRKHGKYVTLEQQLCLHVCAVQQQEGRILKDTEMRRLASEIAGNLAVSDFKASSTWCFRFKRRWGLDRVQNTHATGAGGGAHGNKRHHHVLATGQAPAGEPGAEDKLPLGAAPGGEDLEGHAEHGEDGAGAPGAAVANKKKDSLLADTVPLSELQGDGDEDRTRQGDTERDTPSSGAALPGSDVGCLGPLPPACAASEGARAQRSDSAREAEAQGTQLDSSPLYLSSLLACESGGPAARQDDGGVAQAAGAATGALRGGRDGTRGDGGDPTGDAGSSSAPPAALSLSAFPAPGVGAPGTGEGGKLDDREQDKQMHFLHTQLNELSASMGAGGPASPSGLPPLPPASLASFSPSPSALTSAAGAGEGGAAPAGTGPPATPSLLPVAASVVPFPASFCSTVPSSAQPSVGFMDRPDAASSRAVGDAKGAGAPEGTLGRFPASFSSSTQIPLAFLGPPALSGLSDLAGARPSGPAGVDAELGGGATGEEGDARHDGAAAAPEGLCLLHLQAGSQEEEIALQRKLLELQRQQEALEREIEQHRLQTQGGLHRRDGVQGPAGGDEAGKAVDDGEQAAATSGKEGNASQPASGDAAGASGAKASNGEPSEAAHAETGGSSAEAAARQPGASGRGGGNASVAPVPVLFDSHGRLLLHPSLSSSLLLQPSPGSPAAAGLQLTEAQRAAGARMVLAAAGSGAAGAGAFGPFSSFPVAFASASGLHPAALQVTAPLAASAAALVPAAFAASSPVPFLRAADGPGGDKETERQGSEGGTEVSLDDKDRAAVEASPAATLSGDKGEALAFSSSSPLASAACSPTAGAPGGVKATADGARPSGFFEDGRDGSIGSVAQGEAEMPAHAAGGIGALPTGRGLSGDEQQREESAVPSLAALPAASACAKAAESGAAGSGN